MTPRELFESLYAKHQARASGHPITAADVAAGRQGDSYSNPATATAWQWFTLGRDCVVAVLPPSRRATPEQIDLLDPVEFKEISDRICGWNFAVEEISDLLFEQGVNNVRSS